MRRLCPGLVLALIALLTSAGPAAAAARLEGVPREVRAGQRLEIRWSGLDADAEEVELELSLGGSRWTRISPELEALEGRFTWHVPRDLAGAARIRLRVGGERGEREAAECSLFVLADGAPSPHLTRATPGWWDLDPGGVAAEGWSADRHPRFTAGAVTPGALPAPAVPGGPRESARRLPPRPGQPPAGGSGLTHAFLAPRITPLRI